MVSDTLEVLLFRKELRGEAILESYFAEKNGATDHGD